MNSLQINYAVIFDLLAVFVHFLHDSARLLAIFKLNDHLLRHKVDGSGFDTGGLLGGIFQWQVVAADVMVIPRSCS